MSPSACLQVMPPSNDLLMMILSLSLSKIGKDNLFCICAPTHECQWVYIATPTDISPTR